MGICFETVTRQARFLDPTRNFEPRGVPTEIRTDPLTGESARILGHPHRPAERADLSGVIRLSHEMGCPFCPGVIDQATPRFEPELIPEGRLHVGETTVVPNLFPYDAHSALAIVTRTHFVPMGGFSEVQLADAFTAGQSFFQRVREKDATAAYCSINWNYMPPSGGTMVHPHMQLIGGSIPSNRERLLLESSARYAAANNTNFWLDLVREEERLGARFIAQDGPIAWLTAFVPRGSLDVMAVFLDRSSLGEITAEELQSFASGVRRVTRYFDSLNIYSLNLTLFSAPLGAQGFRAHARIVSRAPLSPVLASDRNYFHVLHGETLNAVRPEDVAAGMKQFWSTPSPELAG